MPFISICYISGSSLLFLSFSLDFYVLLTLDTPSVHDINRQFTVMDSILV